MPWKAFPIVLALLVSACMRSERTTVVQPVPGNATTAQPSSGR